MSIFRAAKEKVTLVAAVTLAAIIGGATTGVVMAAVPDGGSVNTCYKTSGGEVRVIDASNESCANDETALNLSDAMTQTNSALINYSGSQIDQSSRRSVVSFDFVDADGDGTGYKETLCLQFAFDPSTVFAVGPDGQRYNASAEVSADPGSITVKCGDSKYNGIASSPEDSYVTISAYR
jgi:hypothetical protein